MLPARHGGDIFGAARRLDVPISARLDFSASINPLRLSPRVSRRLKEELRLVCHYPDRRQADLRSLVASRENIDPESMLFGNGATQLLYLIPHHLNPKKALLAQPTFSEYAAALRCSGCKIREHQVEAERRFHFELKGLLGSLAGARPDMLILGNPNNPTGAVIPPEILSEIVTACTRRRIHFVVDESFIDFTSQRSLARLASQGRYLICAALLYKILRASRPQNWDLVAHPSTVETLSRELEPWSVNTLAMIAAAEAIKDSVFREKSLTLIARERYYLIEGLVKLGRFDRILRKQTSSLSASQNGIPRPAACGRSLRPSEAWFAIVPISGVWVRNSYASPFVLTRRIDLFSKPCGSRETTLQSRET